MTHTSPVSPVTPTKVSAINLDDMTIVINDDNITSTVYLDTEMTIDGDRVFVTVKDIEITGYRYGDLDITFINGQPYIDETANHSTASGTIIIMPKKVTHPLLIRNGLVLSVLDADVERYINHTIDRVRIAYYRSDPRGKKGATISLALEDNPAIKDIIDKPAINVDTHETLSLDVGYRVANVMKGYFIEIFTKNYVINHIVRYKDTKIAPTVYHVYSIDRVNVVKVPSDKVEADVAKTYTNDYTVRTRD